MPEPSDADATDAFRRPSPPVAWRDVLDLERVLGGRPPLPTIGAALVVVAGLVLAGWLLLRPSPPPPIEESLPMAGSATGPGATASSLPTLPAAEPAEVVVHAAGAVASPGVHRLPAGSRVADLLAAAGGPTGDADLDRVNLAAVLADGAQIRFPRVGEPLPPPTDAGAAGDAPGDVGPVDLNTATAAELEALPGIGPAIAAAIVEHRERNGPFRSLDDLLDVPGIGPARLDELRGAVTV